jgi:hypothetical protein
MPSIVEAALLEPVRPLTVEVTRARIATSPAPACSHQRRTMITRVSGAGSSCT